MIKSEENVNVVEKAKGYRKIYNDVNVSFLLETFSAQLFADIKNVLLQNFNFGSGFKSLGDISSNVQISFEYYQYCVVMRNDTHGNLGLYYFPKPKDGHKIDLSKIENAFFLSDVRSEVCCIDVVSIIPSVSANGSITYEIDSNNDLFKSCPVSFDASKLEVNASVDLIGSYVFDKVNDFVAVSPFSKKGYLIKHFYDDELFSK